MDGGHELLKPPAGNTVVRLTRPHKKYLYAEAQMIVFLLHVNQFKEVGVFLSSILIYLVTNKAFSTVLFGPAWQQETLIRRIAYGFAFLSL